jgi:hypothetical protein
MCILRSRYTHIIDPSIYPNDIIATKDKWGNCIERERQDKIINVTPNSNRACEIIAQAKKEEKENYNSKCFKQT